MKNNASINTLFLSYDGMTDPLGQSQVIPYLKGLTQNGYNITLISCEKSDRYEEHKDTIANILSECNIDWQPIMYHKSPPVFSTIYDIWSLNRKTLALHKKKNFKIIHCRSYISALIGLGMKQKHGTRFLFDMRGFWADERIDGGLWDVKKTIFKKIYNYFKKKELEFLTHADHTISLTENAKKEIHSWDEVKNNPVPIEVIPCCADLEHFSTENISSANRKGFQEKLGLTENDFVLTYLGSVGTWYMLDEMLDFFVELKKKYINAKFLFISNEPASYIQDNATAKNIDLADIKIIQGARKDVPTLISLSTVSIFFIKPVFSKKASSPTKQGELMAMGVPVIANTNVGDTDYIINNSQSGLLVDEFTSTHYQEVINKLDDFLSEIDVKKLKKNADTYYSLKNGIQKYATVYKNLSN